MKNGLLTLLGSGGRDYLIDNILAANLRLLKADPFPGGPGKVNRVGPRARLQAVSRAADYRSEHISRTLQPRFVRALRRSNSASFDRCRTSTPAALLYKHWLPCRPDPVSLRNRARDCKAP